MDPPMVHMAHQRFGAYAARPVAHAVAAPVIRAGPVGYAPAHYAPQYAAAPVQAIHAAPVLRQQVAVAQPIVQKAVAVRQEPFDPHPQYNFGYSVSDQLTGDQHSHTESRDGGVVQGQYSLVEPDGAIRTVTYTSDPVNGFNAVVDRQRPQVAVQKVAAPVAFAQRPIAVAQPVRAVAHVAPAVTAVHAAPHTDMLSKPLLDQDTTTIESFN
ncbi:Cuticle protein 19.8 [Orchesella cincta]|uniref:Cuticle protein 19.8 n=1 Tax=Orchesella cincta TaxID=48709 RepID=A0A1D2MTP5_ORCCI|nr:Cuticle protein 19.8 [Orchesella cincta]